MYFVVTAIRLRQSDGSTTFKKIIKKSKTKFHDCTLQIFFSNNVELFIMNLAIKFKISKVKSGILQQ